MFSKLAVRNDDMLDAVLSCIDRADALIMAAAVSDFRPSQVADQKIKKTETHMDLHMQRTPDILGSVAVRPDRPFVVGRHWFAVW